MYVRSGRLVSLIVQSHASEGGSAANAKNTALDGNSYFFVKRP
jgi:hypothetical protein